MNTRTVCPGEGCVQRRQGNRGLDLDSGPVSGQPLEKMAETILTSSIQAWLDDLQGIKGRIPFKSRGEVC